MVELQVLNRILEEGFDIAENNALTVEYFPHYQKEFTYIREHYLRWGNIPDIETFVSNFNEFDVIQVNEADDYLISTLREEKQYRDLVPIIEKTAELLGTNANEAKRFLESKLQGLSSNEGFKTTDIIHDRTRLFQYQEKARGIRSNYFIPTGFTEIDDAIFGWSREEELIIMFARTNQGKSWVMTKTLGSAVENGFNAGLISPEMSASKIGYRFDTLHRHFENSALNRGQDADGYSDYFDELEEMEAKFCVSTTRDFGGEITVSKIKAFIKANNIEILGIDGLSYLKDERRTRNSSRQEELTHISEDLFGLSIELHVPIIGVVQANRDGVKYNGGELELENIRDSDGISHNASKVVAIRQKVDEQTLELTVKKNRDGEVGKKFIYQWLPNTGMFEYIPSEEDGNEIDREEKIEKLKSKYDGEELPF